VTDVQVAVRFGREAGVDAVEATGTQVFFDDLADEVGRSGCFGHGLGLSGLLEFW
jgi:hypothetical protein